MTPNDGGPPRRQLLRRGLAVLAGLGGLGAIQRAAVTRARSAPRETNVLRLYGQSWRQTTRERQSGEPPLSGDRVSVYGELSALPNGPKVGEFYAAGFLLESPFGADPRGRTTLEMHTFKLQDGQLIGMGAGEPGVGVFAIVGGTGRYTGARGSYSAIQRTRELGGEGDAEFVLTLLLEEDHDGA